MSKNPWTILGEEVRYDNPWIRLTQYKVLNPRGGAGIYGKVHFKNLAIGIAALDEEDQIFLVGQYRFPLNRYSWEIPEGGGPLGTDPLESAKRELLEETGLRADRWQKLLELHLSNSVSDEFGILFMATGLTQHQAAPEETEQLLVKKIPFHEAFAMFERGEITDSLTVVALLKMRLMMDEKGNLKTER